MTNPWRFSRENVQEVCILVVLALVLHTFAYYGWSYLWTILGVLTAYNVHRRYEQAKAGQELLAKPISVEDLNAIPRVYKPAWLKGTQNETAKWLDTALDAIWTHVRVEFEPYLLELINKQLEKVRPALLSKLRLTKFSLGTLPIRCDGITHSRPSADAVWLNLAVVAGGDVDVELEVGVPGASGLVKLDDFILRGTLRLQFEPLVPVAPWFEKLYVSFVEPPFVNFDLTLFNATLTAVPGLSDKLNRVISRDALKFMVNPSKIEVPIIDEVYLKAIGWDPPNSITVIPRNLRPNKDAVLAAAAAARVSGALDVHVVFLQVKSGMLGRAGLRAGRWRVEAGIPGCQLAVTPAFAAGAALSASLSSGMSFVLPDVEAAVAGRDLQGSEPEPSGAPDDPSYVPSTQVQSGTLSLTVAASSSLGTWTAGIAAPRFKPCGHARVPLRDLIDVSQAHVQKKLTLELADAPHITLFITTAYRRVAHKTGDVEDKAHIDRPSPAVAASRPETSAGAAAAGPAPAADSCSSVEDSDSDDASQASSASSVHRPATPTNTPVRAQDAAARSAPSSAALRASRPSPKAAWHDRHVSTASGTLEFESATPAMGMVPLPRSDSESSLGTMPDRPSPPLIRTPELPSAHGRAVSPLAMRGSAGTSRAALAAQRGSTSGDLRFRSGATTSPSGGVLAVQVLRCTKLLNNEAVGLPDPYVRVSVDTKRQQTSTKRNTALPNWEGEAALRFPVADSTTAQLRVEVFNANRLRADAVLGSLRLPLSDICHQREMTGTFPLLPQGNVTLHLTWAPYV